MYDKINEVEQVQLTCGKRDTIFEGRDHLFLVDEHSLSMSATSCRHHFDALFFFLPDGPIVLNSAVSYSAASKLVG